MASNKMLIDATHPEETRVVVLRGGRVEEFDYESAARKLLRGNIYLAKVTRVEPSLQASFIDYGGNRHGFLAFNEIHPDYYQIPVADRQALLEEEAAAEAEEEAAADARAERLSRRRRQPEDNGTQTRGEDEEADGDRESPESENGEDDSDNEGGSDDEASEKVVTIAEAVVESGEILVEEVPAPEVAGGFEPTGEAEEPGSPSESEAAGSETDVASESQPASDGEREAPAAVAEAEPLEQTGSEDALEELPSRPRRRPRSYKIQEVIKRRQVILVQVVKEERGNKGAALTTYLSLAGRYTVLMPNTARGGGISRKITNPQDRKRLKAIAAELEVPEGMGLIIRTAGAARTKQEIKRDFEYLLRLWESVRDLTLQSTAPSLVYEEGNLIKRSIRDLYNKDVEEIIVAGDHAHKDAKDFMRMLMPSHAKNVVLHQEPEPLFTKYGIERQLNAMFIPYVTLKSGGYLVINQTEALVAIDVNSGKATREFSIEETALSTNIEASDEIARQLKLRDLAGLIVIDFIDMEENRNNRAVERRLKDALRFDRARIQLGRISHFGLMEMSRQRLRSGVLEGSTSQCPHCQGTGIIRSTESVALAVLRGLEDALMAGARTSLVATTTHSVALYILNNKRQFINDMEARHGIVIAVEASDKMQGANFTIEKGSAAPVAVRRPERSAVNMDWGFEGETPEGAEAADEPRDEEDSGREPAREAGREFGRGGGREEGRRDEGGRGERGGRRRRRGRGRGERDGPRGEGQRGEGSRVAGSRDDHRQPAVPGDYAPATDEGVYDAGADSAHGDESGPQGAGGAGSEPGRQDEQGVRRRRRGRRGGRRGRDRDRTRGGESFGPGHDQANGDGGAESFAGGNGSEAFGTDFESGSRPEPDVRYQPAPPREAVSTATEAEHRGDAPPPEADAPRARARPRRAATSSEPKIERVVVKPDQPEPIVAPEQVGAAEPARRGWWQRRLSGE